MRRALKIFGFACALVVCAFFVLIWKFHSSLEPSNDVDDYQRALESVPAELVEHFPKAVQPNDGTHFFYRPGFLQGGTTIQLRLAKNALSRQEVRSRIEKNALSHWRGCPRERNSSELELRLQRPGASVDIKCHYDVYVLQESPPEEWNHGHEAGVAISDSRNEVLYWTKVW